MSFNCKFFLNRFNVYLNLFVHDDDDDDDDDEDDADDDDDELFLWYG